MFRYILWLLAGWFNIRVFKVIIKAPKLDIKPVSVCWGDSVTLLTGRDGKSRVVLRFNRKNLEVLFATPRYVKQNWEGVNE